MTNEAVKNEIYVNNMLSYIINALTEIGYDARFSQDDELKKDSVEIVEDIYELLKIIC